MRRGVRAIAGEGGVEILTSGGRDVLILVDCRVFVFLLALHEFRIESKLQYNNISSYLRLIHEKNNDAECVTESKKLYYYATLHGR